MFHLDDDNPGNFNIYNFFAHTYNLTELRMHEDYPLGDIIVYDFKNVKLGHLTQATPTIMKNTSTILENAFNSHIKQVHFLNYPSIAEPLIVLAKQLLNPKISQRFHFHKSEEDIRKFIPIEVLPKDYGGKERSLKELNAIWKQKFADYKERFDKLDQLRVDEALRPTPLINDDVLGFYGNFKKLSVD
nr:alpha-tocopherol transfer protein-like [Leptinotarsa decemlineata]